MKHWRTDGPLGDVGTDASMVPMVVARTEPAHIKGLGIIIVVSMGWSAAGFAGLPLDQATLKGAFHSGMNGLVKWK